MPTERYVSAITSSRAIASAAIASGPPTAIHPSLSCGRAATLESPQSTKVSASRSPAKLGSRSAASGPCA